MKIQRSALVSIGTTWVDEAEPERFIQMAARHYGHTVEQIKQGLADGYEIKTGPAWDAPKIRDAGAVKPARKLTDEEIAIVRGDVQPSGVDDSI